MLINLGVGIILHHKLYTSLPFFGIYLTGRVYIKDMEIIDHAQDVGSHLHFIGGLGDVSANSGYFLATPHALLL